MTQNRTEPFLATYLHQKGARLGLPISGNFELTARCNFQCPMCYIHNSCEDQEKKEKELSAKQWISIAKEARDLGMVFVLLTGGEPFIRPDFFEIYHAFKQMGLLISINTNGSLLVGEVMEKLLEDPPFRMNISLYGGCDETYRKMCGLPAFNTVLNNILTLKQKGVDVCINLSITPFNKDDLQIINEISKQHQIQVRASSYMYPPLRIDNTKYGSGNRLTSLEAAKYSVAWDLLRFDEDVFKQRALSMKNLTQVDETCPIDNVGDGIKCRAGSTAFWLTWDGRMLPCGMLPFPEFYPLRDGFKKAWKDVRNATKAIHTPKKCVTCAYKDVCHACMAVCVTETGAFDEVPEYVCEMTKAKVDLTYQAYLEMENKQ